MKRTLFGLGCGVVLAAAVSPISFANDRAQQSVEGRDADRSHDDGDRDDHDRAGKRRQPEWRFKRIGTFANFRNVGLGNLTVSEIVTSTPDGRTLIYTDAEGGAIGFIDITNPATPLAAGTVALDPDPASAPTYSPTSIAVLRNQYALVAVDTSLSKKQPRGELQVIDLATRTSVAAIDLGGQPDSVKVSPDHRYIAVVVENERDETLCVGGTANDQTVSESACTAGGGRLGGMPQNQLGNPAGYLAVIETGGPPASWVREDVSLAGYASRFPDDPEPEFVDIQVHPATGAVVRTVELPSSVLACRAAERAKTPASTRATASHGSGFEGLDIVAKPGGGYLIYAAQQRGWNYSTTPTCDMIDDDPLDGGNFAEPNQSRLWVFDPSVATNDAAWTSVPYQFQPKPVDAAWIGLSEITYTPDGWILIERDNLTGSFDTPVGAETGNGYKTLVRLPLSPGADNQYTRDEKEIYDLRPALLSTKGWITDRPEGVGVRTDGTVFVVTDNDGVDGSSGETIFRRLGKARRLFR